MDCTRLHGSARARCRWLDSGKACHARFDAGQLDLQEKWSDEEHARFVEAIDKYGRDWGKIVAHIGTRTVAQVRFRR